MALSEKQKQRVDGIIRHINEFLDKRFAQARRINPRLASAEGDLRFHQLRTLRNTLEESKGFGFGRLMVGDILCSADEAKKRDLFNPSNQASIMREIVPADQDKPDSKSDKLEINEVKAVYKAIDPLLEKVVMLVQCWIWWDLRDAADLYRFEAQKQRLEFLQHCDMDQNVVEHYQREMGLKPENSVTKEEALKFELLRMREIVEKFELRLREEPGYQVVVASVEMEGTPEVDATCMRLGRRLMLVEKLRTQQTPLDEATRIFYSSHLGVSPESVSPRRHYRIGTETGPSRTPASGRPVGFGPTDV